MRVAVVDNLQVEAVGCPSARKHGIQLLPGLLSCGQTVHRVGGDALGAVDGGGVAKASRGSNVVGGEPCGEVAAVVSDDQVAAATYSSDDTAVSVFDPVVGREAESAVVGAGDDHISSTGPVPVGQGHLGHHLGVIKTMRPSTTV